MGQFKHQVELKRVIMDDFKIKANEDFFDQVIANLKEGGVYVFPNAGTAYVQKDGFLWTDDVGINAVRTIVSDEYLKAKFKEYPDNRADKVHEPTVT